MRKPINIALDLCSFGCLPQCSCGVGHVVSIAMIQKQCENRRHVLKMMWALQKLQQLRLIWISRSPREFQKNYICGNWESSSATGRSGGAVDN